MAQVNPHNLPPQYPPTYSRSKSRISPWLVRLPILFITGSVLVVLILGIFYGAFVTRFEDRVFPGVSIMGVPLSGLTISEAQSVLAEELQFGNTGVITLRDGDNIWQMTKEQLGVSVDLDATIAQAFAIGHDGDVFSNALNQASAWFATRDLTPAITYNQTIALTFLNDLTQVINQPAVDATLSMVGAQVTTTEGQTGRQLDVQTTLARLDQVILSQQSGVEVPLVINETPPRVWSVDTTADKIRTALSAPVQLTAIDQNGQSLGPWSVSVDQISSLLNVTLMNNADGTQNYDVAIDMSAFSGFLGSLAPGLIMPAQNGRFQFDDNTLQLNVVQPATSGRRLNVDATLLALEQGVFTADNRTVPMVFDFELAQYHNQISGSELGIRELVSESTTYFTGSSSNRRTNIAIGAAKLDGVIIAPGDEFSFNFLIGEISAENGWQEGNVIFGGRTITGVGGGICQVSTTIFRAAFTGGFAITERNSHGYRVGYYEQRGFDPGLDAAIWQPTQDFKFQNDTPHHILIETSVYPNDDALQIRIYSTRTRNVTIDSAIVKALVPALPIRYEANTDLRAGEILQVDYAAEGADVTVYRNISDLNGEFIREDYVFTHYLPWGAIFQVAPGDPLLQQNS